MPGQPEQIPVTVIRDALAKCPDESPTPGTSELNFITDADLRTNLRNDVGAHHQSPRERRVESRNCSCGLRSKSPASMGSPQRSPAGHQECHCHRQGERKHDRESRPQMIWTGGILHECIEVSAELGVIKPNTTKQTRLAKDFRNFIHPGIAQRLGGKMYRATPSPPSPAWSTSSET